MRDRGLEMPETRQDLHWIGISSGVINASVFRMLAVDKFGTGAVYPEVVKHGMYDELPKHFAELKNYRFIIAGGRQPGRSHDTDALLLAALFDNNKVISLKNIDGVYSADPKKNHKAKKITELSWKEYLEIIGVKIHEPGANYPVDALAAQLAMRSGMQFVICDGLDFVELRTVLITGKAKKGSLIR